MGIQSDFDAFINKEKLMIHSVEMGCGKVWKIGLKRDIIGKIKEIHRMNQSQVRTTAVAVLKSPGLLARLAALKSRNPPPARLFINPSLWHL